MTSPPDCRTPPLLHLTPHIRRRIYRFVGLASWDRRNPYRFDLHGRPASSDAPDPSSFHGLLLSCRAIHAEAAALLYSANWFVLYYSHADPASLRPLHALTAPSLRSLSNLKIILNEASCHQLTMYPEGCCLHGYDDDHMYGMYQCKRRHGGLHQLPLLSPASEGSDHGKLAATQAATMLGEWCTAAARLSQVAPGRLALSLVCDIDPQHPQALHVVESAVAPIRLLPPSHLRECHIRLAKTPDSRLQQVARDTVLHACGIPTPSSKPSNATTLTTLPRELRIRILEHTDLVTPRREVTWSRQEDHGYVVFNRGYDGDSTPDECHSAQFFKCWLGKSYVGGPPTNGCFCRRRHAAFSLTCKCWAPPGPALFLVCRALCEDARFVFFSSNRFIVHDFKTSPPWGLPLLDECPEEEPVPTCPYPNARLAASQFLREVVPARSLAHLRFLDWPETQHPAMQDWWTTVDWLRGKINPPGLTLRLVVADTGRGAPPSYYGTIAVHEGDAIMKAYMDLLQPLVPLANDDGLARFYAHLAYPWECTEESKIRDRNDLVWLWREKVALKKRVERYVMGGRYKSLYTNDREEPKLGDWHAMY